MDLGGRTEELFAATRLQPGGPLSEDIPLCFKAVCR